MFPESRSPPAPADLPPGDDRGPDAGYVRQINSTELAAQRQAMSSRRIRQDGLENSMSLSPGQPGVNKVEVNARSVSEPGQTQPKAGDTWSRTRRRPGADAAEFLDNEISPCRAPSTHRPVRSNTPLAERGAIDPETGAVLALVSDPTYNPSIWNNPTITRPNSTTSGRLRTTTPSTVLHPGSTFKLASATAALQTGLISANSTITTTPLHHPQLPDRHHRMQLETTTVRSPTSTSMSARP